MAKLSEIKTDGALKILIYGKAGSGKSCFAAGLPYPTLYLDFDGKVDSAALYYKSDAARLENIDVRNLSKTMVDSPITQFEQIFSQELIPDLKAGKMKYKTIVLDSITTFSNAVLNHIVATNPGVNRTKTAQGQQPGMQDFGILKREFGKIIPNILSLPCNVIMLGHISQEKDEITGQIIRGPLMDGSFSQQLPIYFKEVHHAYRDEKGAHWAQTQSDFKFECRSQIPGLPNPMKLNYAELEKYL